jgi:predicted alpha/beta hydrolase family esterase
MSKKLYIIPGFGETTRDPGYKEITTEIKSCGWEVVPINLKWDRSTTTDWLKQIEKKVEKGDPKNSYVFSFSLGAYLTILLNHKIKFKGYLLCSPSPFFKEDLPKLPDVAKKVMGSKRWEVFQNFKRPSNLQGKATFIIGDGDLPLAIEQTKKMYKGWKGKKKIIILKDVHHDIANDLYISTVLKEIKSISGSEIEI